MNIQSMMWFQLCKAGPKSEPGTRELAPDVFVFPLNVGGTPCTPAELQCGACTLPHTRGVPAPPQTWVTAAAGDTPGAGRDGSPQGLATVQHAATSQNVFVKKPLCNTLEGCLVAQFLVYWSGGSCWGTWWGWEPAGTRIFGVWNNSSSFSLLSVPVCSWLSRRDPGCSAHHGRQQRRGARRYVLFFWSLSVLNVSSAIISLQINCIKCINPVVCTGTSGFLLCPNVLETRVQHPERLVFLGAPGRAGKVQEVFLLDLGAQGGYPVLYPSGSTPALPMSPRDSPVPSSLVSDGSDQGMTAGAKGSPERLTCPALLPGGSWDV